jgi:PglZ domain.
MGQLGPVSSWRQPVLECFTSESATASRLTVVNDPDQLFAEPVLRSVLAERGYELLAYEDPVAFRYLFEHRCRPRWEAGELLHAVVVNGGEASARTVLPYDLLSEARATQREFSFSLPSLFPSLDPNVLSELEPSQFDALSEALQRANPGQLGANATKDFLLNELFGVVPGQIQQPADLLRVLLRRHLRQQQLPPLLDQRLLEQLCLQKQWREWPLERLLPNRAAFFSFLQERWPLFLKAKGCPVVPGRELPAPQLPGPELLPFDHDDIRVFIDNLFAEGLLEPTTAIAADAVPMGWMRLGVVGRQDENAALRLQRLLPLLEEALPAAAASHEDWELFALRWAEAQVLQTELSGSLSPEISSQLTRLQLTLEESFGDWMLQGYSSLANLPAIPRPITLDKVAHFLAYQRGRGSERLALVVVDGLALDQWLLLRHSLDGLDLKESVCWAWVPTITSVSRQTIFAAEAPMFFPQSIGTTSKEPKHWERFWGEQGLLGPAVAYVRQGSQEADSELLEKVKEFASHPACRALGIVVGKVDEMLHGVVTGLGGLHAQVRQWSQQGAFRSLIDSLLEQGFTVYVTADHGNVAAKGIGRPNVGTVPEEKGERAWVFRDDALRAQVQQALPSALLWPGPGLPTDYSVLLPRGLDAFLTQGKETLGHGGIAMEEVLVPFVRIQEPA